MRAYSSIPALSIDSARRAVVHVARFCLVTILVTSQHVVAVETPVPKSAISEQMLFADDPKLWLTLKRVVPPEFPSKALERGETAVVDVELEIDELGYVASIRSIKSNPSNRLFEKSAQDAAKYWLFFAPPNPDCKPTRETGNVRIWFEINGGKPSVSVSSRHSQYVSDRHENQVWREIQNGPVVQNELLLRFPLRARRLHAQAVVFAIISVDAVSGTPTKVTISQTLVGEKSLTHDFGRATAAGLMVARFQPGLFRGSDAYRVCKVVVYAIG